jgi:hypothetical protein
MLRLLCKFFSKAELKQFVVEYSETAFNCSRAFWRPLDWPQQQCVSELNKPHHPTIFAT